MAINMMCMNTKCKYCWEDNCSRNMNGEPLLMDEEGKCETFEYGKCQWYEDEECNEF